MLTDYLQAATNGLPRRIAPATSIFIRDRDAQPPPTNTGTLTLLTRSGSCLSNALPGGLYVEDKIIPAQFFYQALRVVVATVYWHQAPEHDTQGSRWRVNKTVSLFHETQPADRQAAEVAASTSLVLFDDF